VLTRVGIWQVCVDKGIIVGWDAEDAIQALPERFVREKSPGNNRAKALLGGEPTSPMA
jgi:hypothetical protein